MRLIIGASVALAASFILIIVFHISDVKDSNAFSTGDYKSVASGEWGDASIWEVYDGTSWKPAEDAPGTDVKSVTITAGQEIILSEETTLSSLVIEKGGRLSIECNYLRLMKSGTRGGMECHGELLMGDAIIEGDGDFLIGQGAVLYIGSDAGIDKKASSGNIQTKGKRELNKDATYVFNGHIGQHSGNGLPPVISKLVIDNYSGVELDQNLTVTAALELNKGVLNTSRFQLTLGISHLSVAELKQPGGALCGRVKCWYGPGNIDDLYFQLSDGKSHKKLRFTSDFAAYRKGLLELIYKPGLPDDSKKSPYEARHVVTGILDEGFYSASLSNGPDEAWLKLVSSKSDTNQDEVITWNISSEKGSAGDSQKNFSNLIAGPNPFGNFLVVRFHSQSGGMVHLALVNRSGKVVHNEKLNAISGYNQFTVEPGAELQAGDYMIQLSDIAEIQTIRATKKASPPGES